MSKPELSPERRKAVLLCCAVACMSGGPVLLRNHRILVFVWLGVMVATLSYAIALLAKLKEQGK